MSNRLAFESSPYLLQHKDNPVDWYPWGDEALARAKAEDKPILLSIGYSACHWCHVMERESFEDDETAALMNRLFIPIKVDREERPDLDMIYMEAVQRLTGHGGWPMTVFLTPDTRPFYGGTYYPPEPRHGMPAFRTVLTAIAETYRSRRGEVEEGAAEFLGNLGTHIPVPDTLELSTDLVLHAAIAMSARYDNRYGGFGTSPKFPQPMVLELLLRAHTIGVPQALAMARNTLDQMSRGGMYDHLGGGFHRYSVDERWLVPHFEKMLYDNAQLARLYTMGFTLTEDPSYRRTAKETLRYLLREMRSPEGGFYSTQDADSEGHEGRFFLWHADEIRGLLGDDARLFMRVYGVTPRGNFEGSTILHLARPIADMAADSAESPEAMDVQIAQCRRTLFEAREKRVHPHRDDKVLTAWNGLMLRALADAAAAFGDPLYRDAAETNAGFVLTALKHNGRLLRSYRDGKAKINAFLDDYAFLADGLLALYETTGTHQWLTEAILLAHIMIDRFADPDGGPFFSTADDDAQLVSRPREIVDNAVPSGNSVAAEVMLRLAVHTGDSAYREQALRAIAPLQHAALQQPLAFGRILCAADMATAPQRELAIVGESDDPDVRALLRVAQRRFDPNLVIGIAAPEHAALSRSPLFLGREQRDGRATAYLCRHYTCLAPVTAPNELAQIL